MTGLIGSQVVFRPNPDTPWRLGTLFDAAGRLAVRTVGSGRAYPADGSIQYRSIDGIPMGQSRYGLRGAR